MRQAELESLLASWEAVHLREGLWIVDRRDALPGHARELHDALDNVFSVEAQLLVVPLYPGVTLGLAANLERALEGR